MSGKWILLIAHTSPRRYTGNRGLAYLSFGFHFHRSEARSVRLSRGSEEIRTAWIHFYIAQMTLAVEALHSVRCKTSLIIRVRNLEHRP